MSERPDAPPNEIVFHTPDRRSEVYAYRVLVAGRSCFRPQDGLVTRRFHHQTLICTTSGLGRIHVGERAFPAPPRSLVWLDTSTRYAHGCHPGSDHWCYLWFGCEGYQLDALFRLLRVGQAPIFGPVDPPTEFLFEQLIANLAQREPKGDAISNAAVAELLAKLVQERGAREDGGEDRIERVMSAIRGDVAHDWRVGELAAISNLSAAQLHRRFKQKTGTTPMDWIRHERMNSAKRLLVETRRTIAAVGQACGYRDPYHFSRDFRRTVGVSPSGFRSAHAERSG